MRLFTLFVVIALSTVGLFSTGFASSVFDGFNNANDFKTFCNEVSSRFEDLFNKVLVVLNPSKKADNFLIKTLSFLSKAVVVGSLDSVGGV